VSLVPARLLAALRCPVCRQPLVFSEAPHQPAALPNHEQAGAYGVLLCDTHVYPVIDGIPVLRTGQVSVQDHMTGREEVAGPSVADLVETVQGPKPVEALVDLLAFPPALPLGLEQLPVLRLPFTRGPGNRAMVAARRAKVRHLLAAPIAEQTAQDWLELGYLRSRNVNRELYPYFLLRFGQPRYLASLSLATLLPTDGRPVLDLACGFGHLLHHLGSRANPVPTVGVDRNFFQLWVARRWIAPHSDYVCADAAKPLPFADDAFGAAVCTDAFHLFPNQRACLAELRRCGGLVVIDRVGNGLLEPHDVESELHPAGYVDLLDGAPYRMIGQRELVADYLAGHGPALAKQKPLIEFAEEKWLSMIIDPTGDSFVDHPDFATAPHGEGRLGVNPIYRVEHDEQDVRLLFEFPSTWYAFENFDMLSYHSAGIRLSSTEFAAARAGKPGARTDDLVRRFVLIGMPERYARVSSGR
jgi:SAM-dependent methyltransferase/uncharacterized protein YbaR (Trm112 family)